jgi:hypothetical protein
MAEALENIRDAIQGYLELYGVGTAAQPFIFSLRLACSARDRL